MLRRISELREANSYLGYQKTRAEMFEWIRYEWELPKVFDRQVTGPGEVAQRVSPIQDKLKRIEIPGVNFFNTNLVEVVNTLMSFSRQNDFAEPDPAAKGVNIIPMLGGEEAPEVTIQLNKMTLGKMLDFITEMVGWTYEVRDDAVVVSEDCPGDGANVHAPWFDTVHALVLGHQPCILTVDPSIVELDKIPEAVAEIGLRLVGPVEDARRDRPIVPFLAGHFAGLAADARSRVDQLGDGGCVHPHASRASRCRGNCLKFSTHLTFSTLTRKPLYSGVPELGSNTLGLRLLTSGPVTCPMKPQWMGRPTW